MSIELRFHPGEVGRYLLSTTFAHQYLLIDLVGGAADFAAVASTCRNGPYWVCYILDYYRRQLSTRCIPDREQVR